MSSNVGIPVNLENSSVNSRNQDPQRIPTLKLLPDQTTNAIPSVYIYIKFISIGRSSKKPEEKGKGRGEMEECMRECMRKLALWFTRTFKPIITHDELVPIMDTLGFVALPHAGSPAWKEYVYVAGGCRYLLPAETPLPLPPRPRLPYPRIDGLHICTYRAFIDAVNFYLEMSNTSDLFHIRYAPLSLSLSLSSWFHYSIAIFHFLCFCIYSVRFPFRDLFCLCSWRSKAFPSLSFRVSDSLWTVSVPMTFFFLFF